VEQPFNPLHGVIRWVQFPTPFRLSTAVGLMFKNNSPLLLSPRIKWIVNLLVNCAFTPWGWSGGFKFAGTVGFDGSVSGRKDWLKGRLLSVELGQSW